jgi:F-type H+-transporting ATPase subunit delta
MSTAATHDTVLDVGSARARLAKVYAEALLAAAGKQGKIDETGAELASIVADVLDHAPDAESFLASPVVGKRAKIAALTAALPGRTSELVRGLFIVLAQNNRLSLARGISQIYQQLLDERAGRVPIKVTAATELSQAQRESLEATLSRILKQHPVLEVKVDPELLGGLIVQVGDRVIDTTVRTRLQSLRTLLLDSHM